MGAKQRQAIKRLLNTLCSLSRKKWTATEVDDAEGEVIMTVCEVEAYLPLTENDMKLHAVTHMPRKVRRTGPLWVTAMWVYEGMWKQLLRFASNQAAPELSMLRAFADYELAMFAFWLDPERFAIKPIIMFQEECVEEMALRYQIPRGIAAATVVQFEGLARNMRAAADAEMVLALHMYYLQYDDR